MILESLISNFIYIAFPLFFYYFYLIYRKNIGKEENDMFLDFILLSSFYLILRNKVGFNEYQFILVNIVLIISYLRKRYLSAILMSIFIIATYYSGIGDFIFVYIIEYIIYLLISIIFQKKQHFFINSFFAIKLLSLIIYKGNIDLYNIITYLILTYILLYFILYLLKKGEEIITYHMSIKEIEQQKQIRTSLFKITHEIKNPIAVCKGYLDMFDVNNKEHARKYVPILKNEISRTLSLLEDFLAMTKIKVNKEILDINVIIEDVLEEMKPILKANNISVNLNILDDEIYIDGDYNRLMQVFVNIIKNSIEANNKNKGNIIINEELKGRKVFISITDNGIGINKEVLEKLGEPFYTTKKNGTGLGVSLSYEIISAHDGSINYSSEYNEGTTVQIKLPLLKN